MMFVKVMEHHNENYTQQRWVLTELLYCSGIVIPDSPPWLLDILINLKPLQKCKIKFNINTQD